MWSRTCTALLTAGATVAAATLAGAPALAAARPTSRGEVAAASPAERPAPPKPSPTDTLGAHDAELLAHARTSGARRVTLIIATERGAVSRVAAAVQRLGGTVARRFDKVGYVLAQVPTAQVLKAAGLPGIAAVDLDERIRVPRPEAQDGTVATAVGRDAGPGRDTPAANPYLPTHEIGSVAFKAAHPTWDGRGVTVGIMDSGVDLDHPALRETSTGQRKIVDWVTATDPLLDDDGTWRPMVNEVSGPTFTFAGVSYTAPPGVWRFNRFSESITMDDDAAGDVNRDGDTTDTFGILYDPANHDIRVDSDSDHDFTDDAVMRPYRQRFDVGYFGTDDPATPIAERIPFVVEFRLNVNLAPLGLAGQVADFVNIGLPESSHATHVAGIVAGNDLLGDENLDGQAPGARIVSSRACSWGGGCTASALTTGMVDLVVNRHVDVVNMSIGGLPALNDANNARAALYDKLIDDYGVQLFVSAGNSGPGLNTVGDPSIAGDVVSVAASVSKDTWLADYGAVVTPGNALFNFSSRGPREDGGFKPNIVAPGAAISTINSWLPGAPVPEAGYPLPPGYAMFNGTSMASPQAAGGAALLLSAAKATDRAITPAALRRALYTSAEPIPGTSVAAQGNGLMDVDGAWALLAKPIETRTYRATAPVCTPLSGYLATAGSGAGIYNRCAAGSGGQRAGKTKIYTVRITRTSGPSQPINHRLTWYGGNGAFASAGNVLLPLNVTMNVQVIVTPTLGLNSAILRVDDPSTSIVDFEILNTVVVATEPTAPSFTVTEDASVQRGAHTSYFVRVPSGATALQVNLTGIATGSQVRFIAINPWGVPVEDTSSLVCYTNRPLVDCKPQQRVYQNPMPGVWELEVEARRTTASLENPYQLSARILGVTIIPPLVELASVTAGKPAPVSWKVHDTFGPVVVSGRGGPLGSAIARHPTIADHEDKKFQIDVPTGATRLAVSIGNTSDRAADLDLSVQLDGREVAGSADGDSEESVSIDRPAAGIYTVIVSGYAVPAGTTTFDYLDAFFSPQLGRVAVSDDFAALANRSATVINGTVTAAAPPSDGRTLLGQMTVVTDSGAIVGAGAVTITTVTTPID